MPRTDVPQRELRGLTPHDITQHYATEWVTAFQMEGHQLTTCLQIRRILEGHVVRPEGLPARGLTDCRPLISQQHQLAPSVENVHFCLSPHQYKRTAWSGRDRWKVHAQTLPSSSQPPEVAAMERQVRDLTANLQELTRQNQILNQRLRQHETEKQKEKDKGKNKERGDAESRQERQQEQQQEQQEQRQEQEGETRGENTRITVEQPSAKWEEEIKAMRAQMGEMKDEFKGRATKNIDDLVQGTDSPFTEKVISFPLPSKFRMPSLEIFDGSKDPLDHLESFKTVMCLQGVPDEIMCRAFPTTLKGPARIWFKKLMPGSLVIRPTGKKRKGEHADRPAEPQETRPKAQRNRNGRQEERSGRGFNERFNRFTPLNAPVDHIFMQIRNDPALKWPGKLLTDPDKRPRDKYCRFHRDHGHNTENCYDLKRQIEELIKQGKLQRFIRKRSERRPSPGSPSTTTSRGSTSKTPTGRNSRTHPKQAMKKVNFLVVDCPSAYNVIIGRPTLNRLRAVTSTYHLLVRFPTENGIGEMKGDQAMARECYLTTVNAEQVHQTLIVEERQNVAEPTEELEEIVLIEGDEKKTTRIGTSMAKEIRASVVSFLRENADVFAWSHDDMPGISTEVISHKLNVNPSTPPRQAEEAGLRPGKKHCCDGRDLNKACPKDSYPLPRIDQLVDSTAGHKLLSFMDAFSGYNQIQMTEGDQEKTAFITSRRPFLLQGTSKYTWMTCWIKRKKDEDHLSDLKETFQTLRRYNMKLNPAKCVFGVSSGKFLGFMVSQRGIEANPDKIKAILDMSPPKTIKEVQSLTGKAAALNRFVSRSTDKCLPFFRTLRKAFQWTEECQKAFEELKAYLSSPPLLSPSQTEFTQPWKDEEDSEEGKAWTVNIDGSSTKEMSGAGVVLVSPEKDKFEYALQLRFRATNNEAEYEALLAGLKLSKSMGIENLTVKSDSQLIVGQVKGEYEAKEDRMKKYLMVVKNLLTQFKKVELLQIPREENEAADRLARLASSGVEIDGFVEIQGRPSTEKETINPISFTTTWMLPIIRYLKEGTLPADRAEAHKLRIRASRFQLLGGILYKMGFSRPHLRCLSPEEANYVIREVHEGVCGNHSGARSLVHKLTRAGYYWPSLLHDATQFVKACDKCQRFANVPRVPPEEFTPITSPWPFAQWGLDIMGPFPVGTKQAKFLVVAIDYFTKWVEAEPLATISEKNVKSFVWKAVICRFGIPRVLISDNGKQFDNGPFRELCAQLNIRNHYSSPRHPQANGQVENPNQGNSLQAHLWHGRLFIPVEIGLTTLRTTFHNEGENEGQLRLNLDLLDEARERAARRIALYQGKDGQSDTHEVHKSDTHEVHKSDTHKVHKLDTFQGAQVRHLQGAQVRHPRGAQVRHPRGDKSDTEVHEVTRCKSDTHEVHKLDTFKVHELDTHEVQVRHPRGASVRHLQGAPVRHPRGACTMEAHQENCSPTSQPALDTQGCIREEDRQEHPFSTYYQMRHPRGASREEDRQECPFSTYYQVRHPRGASREKDRQEVPSLLIIKEEDRQECPFSTYYQVRHPRGASREEDLQECPFSTYYQVRHPRGASREEDRQEHPFSTYYQVRHPRGAFREEDRQEVPSLLIIK
uniref:Uncharacterized protein n=1 Tax=Fagus sylvatica TaxID=28930 RepID=A0A2N9J520_FAGSY